MYMSLVSITVEGALVYGLGAHEPACRLAMPLSVTPTKEYCYMTCINENSNLQEFIMSEKT